MAKNDRFSRKDWLQAGLAALVADGPVALRAAPLARQLGVTTGSFYWHFRSVADFHQAVLDYWRTDVIEKVVEDARAEASSPERVLDELGALTRRRGIPKYDAAARRWAETSALAARAVKRADAWRRNVLLELLRERGLDERQALDKLNLLAAAWQGSATLKDQDYRVTLAALAVGPPERPAKKKKNKSKKTQRKPQP